MKEFIKGLFRQGIHIKCENKQLKISHNGNLTEEIKASIREHKEAIIAFFEEETTRKSYASIETVADQESYVLSSGQYRLWVLSQYEGGSQTYNLPLTTLLIIEDLAIFERAIHAVIDRHEILRTIFKENADGEIRQWIKKREDLAFELIHNDYRGLENAGELAASFVAEDSVKPFDFENGPLLRMALLQHSDTYFTFYYNMHHIVSDGLSMEILSRDLKAYYEAFLMQKDVVLPALNIQYKDYAYWQKAELQKSENKEHKAYWVNRLSGDLPTLNLPTDKIRPEIFSHEGKFYRTCISPEITKPFLQYCKEQQSSLYIGLLAVWNVLFHKYSGENDFLIASPTAGRDHTDLKDQIGFYINTLVLRNQVDASVSFDEFFKKVKEDTLSAYDHQMYPLDVLVDDLKISRDNSRSGIFDVILTSQNVGNQEEEYEMVAKKQYGVVAYKGECRCKFDLELDFEEVGDVLSYRMSYNTNVYDGEMIEGLMKHFQELLASIVKNPAEKIQDLNYITTTEQQQLTVDFNKTPSKETTHKTYISLFKEQVVKTPNNQAIICGENVLTYKELDELSDDFATFLQTTYNIQSNNRIAIKLLRTNWLLVGMLGVFKSGACYVPIDTDYPADRIQYIENDSNCVLTIDNEIVEKFKTQQTTFSGKEHVNAHFTNDDPAYIIYTSGSTGKPKGVEISHASFVDYVTTFQTYFQLTTEDRIIHQASISFDTSIEEIFPILLSGGALVIATNDKKDIEGLLEICKKQEITVFSTNPPTLQYLNSIYGENDFNFRILINGGDVLKSNHIDQLWDKISVYNTYGPTESTVCATYYKVTSLETNIPIGKPISNREIYILEKNSNTLVSKGIVGEICIGGSGIAKKYINRPELTTEKFIAHPFKNGARLYRTGDFGKWRADGNILFIGRKDDQVKIKGFRIELGEIENALIQKETIKNTIVLVEETATGTKELVAYIVSKTTEDTEELRNYLSVSLPEHMLPNYFIQLEEMPLTINGKVDKKALLNLKENKIKEAEYVAPRTTEEKVLADVWKTLLNHEEIGVTSKFFTLGGDSIKAIQVVSRLKKIGYTLSVKHILSAPILEDMASHMTTVVKKIDQHAVVGNIALTPIQSHFFADKNVKEPHHFNQSILIKSSNQLDNALLEKCLQQLVNHHDALRMTFTENAGNITQFNQKAGVQSYSLNVYDLRQNGALEAQISEMTAIANELQSSINLENGPLVRVGNFRLKDGDYIALIIHHLIIDGISWRILLEDLSTLYNLAENGKKLVLPSKTDSYQEWSKALTNHALNGISSKEQDYWKGLTATEIPALPTDHENTSNEKTSAEVTFQLNKEFTNILQTKAHSVFNTEINDILLTSLGLAIKDVLKVDRTVINMEGHGREEFIDGIDITRTIGWFTSLFPFILDVTDGSDLKNLIKVKESLRNIPNKGIGYGMLKYLKKENFKHELTPEIEFNYLGDFGNELSSESNEVPQFQYVSDSIGNNISKENTDDITLNISGIMVNNQLELNLFYYKEDYDQETVEKLWNAYKYHLENIIGELSETDEQLLTPSDMTFTGLSIDTLQELNQNRTIDDVYKLSPLQRGMYFLWLSNDDSRLFFDQVSYRFDGIAFTIENIKKAFDTLIERHAILRTSFSNSIDEELLQIVHKNVPSNFEYQKLPSNLTEAEKLAFVETFKENDMDKGFDLAKPCQMRLSILELEDKKYEFIWSHHHILMDGWCMRTIINEFAEILQSIETNTKPNLATAHPYANYIKWLDTLDDQKSLNYWNKYLSGISQNTTLPYQKTGYKNERIFIKNIASTAIDGALFEQMKKHCLNMGISHNVFVQAVWGYLLSSYNNTQDVVFGTVVSGRPAHINGIENMVGLFVNTIPVRVNYTENDSPKQLLEKLHKHFLEGQEYHYTELSEIQALSGLDTDLIKHTLTFENYPLEEAIMDADKEEKQETTSGITSVEFKEQMNYPFGISVYPGNDEIQIEFEYNPTHFEKSLIENLAVEFKTVASEFLANIEQPLKTIQVVPKNIQHELLTKNNNTSVEFTQDSVVDLFKVQVATNPEMVAIATETKKYTYSELDALSNQYANYLRSEHNITTNDYVGIQLERSEWLVISILAILKIGGTYIPIDPQYPQERINYIVEDSHCKLLIDTTALEAFQNGNFPSTLEETTITPETTAYALYTSGSTGKPKGVLISHASLTNYLTWGKSYYLNEERKKDFGLFTSLSFDLTVTSLFLPLLNGGKLHIYNAKAEITDILQHYFESDLNCIKLTPAHISVLDNLTIKNSSIETAIVGGDKLEQKHIDTLKRINPSMRIYNEYGPTEATVGCVVSDVSEVTNGEILIGKPIANTEIYILNELGNIQPKGIKGELYIGGKGLAKGYLNKEELTAEKFIENPYKTGERLYKTGDVGSWTLDGNIEFFGRKDDQVKIRGYRIELGEIENSLKSLETIDEAVVLINKKEDGEHRIVAYYTSKVDTNSATLTAYLESKIPTYMLPSSYTKVDEMPLTINGKVDKKALLALQSDSQETATAYIAPKNEIEEKLVEIWADILKIDTAEISADANFMDLGGHSLKVIRVIARIQKEYGIKINIQTFFGEPILATIAEDIATIVWNNTEEEEEELESFSI